MIPRRDVARRAVGDGTVVMMVGSVVAGVATYGWHAAGARSLGEVEFAPVATVWTLMFLMITVLVAPIEQYAIRTVAAAGGDRSALARALPTIGAVAMGATAVVAVLTWSLRGQLFDGDGSYVAVCAAILLGFGQLGLVRGVLAGERDFAAYGWITGLDSCLRLAVGIPLLVGGASALALAWTVPACSLVALAWLGRRRRPIDGDIGADPVRVGPGRFIAHTVGGTIPSQMILAGGPLVVAFLGAGEAAVTTIFVTQTAFRAAFLIATPGWSRALPALTRRAVAGEVALLQRLSRVLVIGTLAAAAAGGFLAALVAPPAVALLFGAGTRPDVVVAGLSMAGTLAAVGNLGLTTLLVARVRTGSITVTWWCSLAAAAALVAFIPGDPALRAAAAFAGAEAFAALGLGAAARVSGTESWSRGGGPVAAEPAPTAPPV